MDPDQTAPILSVSGHIVSAMLWRHRLLCLVLIGNNSNFFQSEFSEFLQYANL